MDSDKGGRSDAGRDTAIQIARKRVLEAYDKAAASAAPSVEAEGSSSDAETSEQHLKNRPEELRVSAESWRKYHSEWQQYYQKYYSEYYSRAARDYIASERLKAAHERAGEDDILYALAHSGDKKSQRSGLTLAKGSAYQSAEKVAGRLRSFVQKKASDEAQKTRRFRKYLPLIAGGTVAILLLFLQYNRLIFAPIMAYVSPGNAPASGIEALDPSITQAVSAEPRLIIPKLNVDVPIRFGVLASDVMAAMNNGVAHYRITGASAYPGEIGNFVVTGHSAGDVYSSNPYKYIFSGLERLEDGDLIYVNYESTRYTYQIIKKEVVSPSNVDALRVQTDKPIITLITCTPLGTSLNRLLVTGEQISPSYADSGTQESAPEDIDDDDATMPSNSPSFFEGIWNWLTGQ